MQHASRHTPPADLPPITPVHYAEEPRFEVPKPTPYPVAGSLLSIASLALLTFIAGTAWYQLRHPDFAGFAFLPRFLGPPAAVDGAPLATWATLPFFFTMLGAGLGLVFETLLLVAGIPFQQGRNRATRFVRQLRLLNLAPVVATILFFVLSLVTPYPGVRVALLCAALVLAVVLGFGLFLGRSEAPIGIAVLGIQLLQILLVAVYDLPGDHTAVMWFLIAQAVLQVVALVIGTATPLRSTGFHVLTSLSAASLYGSIHAVAAVEPGYTARVAVSLPVWGIVLCVGGGLLVAARLLPKSLQVARAAVSNAVWSLPNFLLVSNPRFPDPKPLGDVYRDGKVPEAIPVKPYYQVHPEYLIQRLAVPEATRLPESVLVFKKLVKLVRTIFRLMAPLDQVLPQANVATPIEDKPRMEIWSDGREYWPRLFRRKLFGRTVPGDGDLEKTPQPAIEAFHRGQLLAYLCESGIGAPLVRPVPDEEAPTLAQGPHAQCLDEIRRDAQIILDLRFLEGYETKADYESYGGRAYFRIDRKEKALELVSVVAPHSDVEIAANPHDPSFRHAESLILASLYFFVVSGKHLVEIHMTYALVEVVLHNAFEAKGQWNHPFRNFLYLHLFSHGLAETLTTEHLVQEGAVFAQIFATSSDGLIRHLTDRYVDFEYGDDEDFESRKAWMSVDGTPLPKSAIAWELRYAKIFQTYTESLIDVIYEDDAAVRADTYLQGFFRSLDSLLLKGLPDRYDGFASKRGVARYASDTIYHLVIRHQVYGTTSVKAALDPRISKTQVPRDTGTTPIDEWRSLASVALATERARFTLLLGDFKYLFEHVDARYRPGMEQALDRLQADLRQLDEEWTRTEDDLRFNYDYFRPVPSELHTGAGY